MSTLPHALHLPHEKDTARTQEKEKRKKKKGNKLSARARHQVYARRVDTSDLFVFHHTDNHL
jgi:hypothetical protein